MPAYRLYVADIDTGDVLIESCPEDAVEAWEGLREYSQWGWVYGPVTAEEDWLCYANGWVADDATDRAPVGLLSRLAAPLRGRRLC